MHHIIYKTTNIVNRHFYVGMQSTRNLDDGYLGSGKRIKLEIKKHGKENFQREILAVAVSRKELKILETKIVNEQLLSDPLCINIKLGGQGGWDYANLSKKGKAFSKEHVDKIKKNLIAYNPTSKHRMIVSLKGKTKSPRHRFKISQALMGIKNQIVQCPHCNKYGGDRAMKRWHMDNCKMRD